MKFQYMLSSLSWAVKELTRGRACLFILRRGAADRSFIPVTAVQYTVHKLVYSQRFLAALPCRAVARDRGGTTFDTPFLIWGFPLTCLAPRSADLNLIAGRSRLMVFQNKRLAKNTQKALIFLVTSYLTFWISNNILIIYFVPDRLKHNIKMYIKLVQLMRTSVFSSSEIANKNK